MKNCTDCNSSGGKTPAKKPDGKKKVSKPVRTFPAMTLTTKGSFR